MSDKYDFGYPRECVRCGADCKLQVGPHWREGSGPRLMLVGQDPTILKSPGRVKEALMLDDGNGQLRRWLRKMFGEKNFDALTLYATNIVKCTFDSPPSKKSEGGLRFLEPFFKNCRDYIGKELKAFRPSCVLTFGEPTHQMFSSILDDPGAIPPTMQGAFTGRFMRARFNGFEFDYSPCLHIKTFRVAETYGESVKEFKDGVKSYFRSGA